MEYSTEQVRNIIMIYHNLNQISHAYNSTFVYLSNDLDSLKQLLKYAKELPEELYKGKENLEETFQRGISFLEQAIQYKEEEQGLREVKQKESNLNNPFLKYKGFVEK